MLDIVLEHINTIPNFDNDYDIVSHFITLNGDAIYLHKKKLSSDNSSSGEKHYKVVKQSKTSVIEILLPPIITRSHLDPIIDIFSDGSLLIVDRRCQYRSVDDYDYNGMIYNPTTKTILKFLAGDGIEQVLIDRDDHIWISYFDEGICGNYGWGNILVPPFTKPIGKPGVNCFDSKGNIIWSFNDTEKIIDDCYAMNITSKGTHIFYYSDFDFCTISKNFQTQFFTSELAGCSTFAMSDNYLLFNGQYGDPISTAYLVKKTKESLVTATPVTLRPNYGESFLEGFLIGRDEKLHLFTSTDWYAISARDAFEQTTEYV